MRAFLGIAGVVIWSLVPPAAPAAAQSHFQMPPPVVEQPAAGGRRVTADGLVANWYPVKDNNKATILLLGGAEGGIGPGTARQAEALVTEGFAVMQLAYFGAPGLPANLNMVPLEYFDTALSWLRKQPDVDASRIGLVGASKGAEAALLIAARHPELKAVVVGAPSAVVWPGIDFSEGPTDSSWSLDGKAVPYLRYGESATSMFTAYQTGLATLPQHPESAIPVQSIDAHVMLVCGRSDMLWPSCPMSRIVAQKMDGIAKVLAYTDAGHAVFGPPVAIDAPGYASLGALGGSPAGTDAARSNAWPQVISFLTEMLK